MASGAADRLDVTTWIPSARPASAPRSGWEAAGVAARADTSSQERFGAALSAAQARDDAAETRARAADQRDMAASARTRQADQRDQAEAARAASDRARDSALQTDARAADRKAGLARQADAVAPTARATQADAPRSAADARAEARAPAATHGAETGRTESTAQPRSEAAATAQDPTSKTTETAARDTAPTETTALPQKADAAAQPAGSGPSASLLALIAALTEGGAATGTGKTDADAGTGAATVQDSGAAPSGTGAAAGLPGTGAQGGSHAGGEVSGIAGIAPGATAAGAGSGLGKVEKSSIPVDGPTAGTPAAASSDRDGQDFLAALADAGRGANPLEGTPPAAQGAPTPPVPSSSAAGATNAAQGAAAPTQTAAPVQTDPPIPIGQVPMTIGLRSLRGSNEFQIRLDPAELGRIDVKLEIDKAHGRVMTHLVVDRPETLALLQRDAGQLQQALSQAGFDPAGGGLNLSLRGDGSAPNGGSGGQQGDSPRSGGADWPRDQAEAPQDVAPIRFLRGYGGVDMRI